MKLQKTNTNRNIPGVSVTPRKKTLSLETRSMEEEGFQRRLKEYTKAYLQILWEVRDITIQNNSLERYLAFLSDKQHTRDVRLDRSTDNDVFLLHLCHLLHPFGFMKFCRAYFRKEGQEGQLTLPMIKAGT